METHATVVDMDWEHRWIGGLCPLGAGGGLPVREADYAAHPPLETLLYERKPSDALQLDDGLDVEAAWADFFDGAPVVLLRSVNRAYEVLLGAVGLAAGEPVAVPANATRFLVEAVKSTEGVPLFAPLDEELQPRFERTAPARFRWIQPVWGGSGPKDFDGVGTFMDRGDTLPRPHAARATSAWATVWGLHLSDSREADGALVVFAENSPAQRLASVVRALVHSDDLPDPSSARAQLVRLPDLARRQMEAAQTVWEGLFRAAGLPMRPLITSDALPLGIGVRIPDVADPSTFLAYVRGENTPVRWMPEVRPLHYAAVRAGHHLASAEALARWLLVPVGPDYSDEEVKHSVLGIVKASDYLGVRWQNDPQRAAAYADTMVEQYGPVHDAYRPAFRIPGPTA